MKPATEEGKIFDLPPNAGRAARVAERDRLFALAERPERSLTRDERKQLENYTAFLEALHVDASKMVRRIRQDIFDAHQRFDRKMFQLQNNNC